MVKINFYVDERQGRMVAISFNGGQWYTVKWSELPSNIQWLLAEMSVGKAKIKTDTMPWLEEWQNGR